jgi:hypothetical protein
MLNNTAFRSILLLIVCHLSTIAADITQRPSEPSSYFYHVFMSMTNPDRPAAESLYFEKMYSTMNRLTDADVASLRVKVEEFRSALMEVRAQSAAVAQTDQYGQATHALNVGFQTQVEDIGNRFLAELSPEGARRVRIAMGSRNSVPSEPANITDSGNGALTGVGASSPHIGTASPHDSPLPSAFLTCISASGSGSTCTLAAGTYDVNGSATYPILKVGRGSSSSPLTIEGAAGGGTILKRTVNGTTWPTSIGEVLSGVYDVTFSYLTFEGNSPNMPAASYEGSYFDLDLQEGTGSSVVWDTYVSNCTFQDTPALAIFTNYYSYISDNTFTFNSTTAYSGTHAIQTYNNNYTAYSTNIQFNDNTVYNAGGGATAITGSTDVEINGNIFAGNQQNCTYEGWGSQVGVVENWGATYAAGETGYWVNSVEIENNTIDGPSPAGVAVSCSSGLELYGTNYTIEDNVIINHAGSGLVTLGLGSTGTYAGLPTGGATISGNYIGVCPAGNSYCAAGAAGNSEDGILLEDFPTIAEIPCPTAIDPTYLFTISSNYIEHNGDYAIEGIANSCVPPTYSVYQAPNSSTVSLSSNTISSNGNNTPYYH